jgi:hypothetical protein
MDERKEIDYRAKFRTSADEVCACAYDLAQDAVSLEASGNPLPAALIWMDVSGMLFSVASNEISLAAAVNGRNCAMASVGLTPVAIASDTEN